MENMIKKIKDINEFNYKEIDIQKSKIQQVIVEDYNNDISIEDTCKKLNISFNQWFIEIKEIETIGKIWELDQSILPEKIKLVKGLQGWRLHKEKIINKAKKEKDNAKNN